MALIKCTVPTGSLNWVSCPARSHALPDEFFKSYKISSNILTRQLILKSTTTLQGFDIKGVNFLSSLMVTSNKGMSKLNEFDNMCDVIYGLQFSGCFCIALLNC